MRYVCSSHETILSTRRRHLAHSNVRADRSSSREIGKSEVTQVRVRGRQDNHLVHFSKITPH